MTQRRIKKRNMTAMMQKSCKERREVVREGRTYEMLKQTEKIGLGWVNVCIFAI